MPKPAMQILKFRIKPAGDGHPSPHCITPPNATVMSVQMLPDGMYAYFAVEAADIKPAEPHYFAVVRTGQPFPATFLDTRFLGTVQYFLANKPGKPLVEHVFHIGQPKSIITP